MNENIAVWVQSLELAAIFNFYMIKDVIYYIFYEMNLTWVGYFNRPGPELTHFNIDSGLIWGPKMAL